MILWSVEGHDAFCRKHRVEIGPVIFARRMHIGNRVCNHSRFTQTMILLIIAQYLQETAFRNGTATVGSV